MDECVAGRCAMAVVGRCGAGRAQRAKRWPRSFTCHSLQIAMQVVRTEIRVAIVCEILRAAANRFSNARGVAGHACELGHLGMLERGESDSEVPARRDQIVRETASLDPGHTGN